jgi:hypothetical protein
MELKVRCSELSNLMTKGRSKAEPLGETAKSYIQEKAKCDFYGLKPILENKYLSKGIANEQVGIELVNQVRFMDFLKNTERIDLGWLTGECDINAEDRIIDIKCSWSFDTFPAYEEEAQKSVKKSGYDWQMRGYMMLYNKEVAEVIYCLTSTPNSLLSAWDDLTMHKVDHIEAEKRITAVRVQRDLEIEEQIKEQYKIGNEYYKECINELLTKNQQSWI